jgi:hypothetical protein
VSIFATAVVGLMLVVPGVGASLALYRPGRIHLPTRLASFLVFGYAVVAVVATVLTNLRVMRPAVFVVVLVVVTAVLWFLAVRRGLREHLRVMARQVRDDPWPLLVGALVILALAVVRWRFSPLVNFGHTEPWRYWADAQEIARVGHVPPTAIHYGSPFPTTVSKIVLNAFNAGVIFTIGSAPLPAMGALAWLVSVGANLSLWSVGRELGLRYTAPLLVVLTQAESRWASSGLGDKIVFHYNAAYVGEMVALCALALGIRAIRDRRWSEVAVVGILFGVAAGTHLIPVVVFGALLVWYGIGHALARREVLKPAATLVVIGALTGGIALGAIFTSGGDVGFQGAGGANRYASFSPDFDPTLYLAKGTLDQPTILQPDTRQRLLDGWYILPGDVLVGYVDTGLPVSVGQAGAWIVVGLTLALAIVMLLIFPEDVRPLGVMAWGFGATLVLVSLGFSYLYTTKVPGDFGVHRLAPSVVFAVVIMLLALLESGIWLLGRVGPRLAAPVGAALVAILAVLYIPHNTPPAERVDAQRGSLEALAWIRHNVPPHARIVTSRRTAGTFAATVGRVSVTEGMSPYLRPAMLKRVIHRLLQARAFFHAPVQDRGYLARQDVSYVVFIKGGTLGSQGALLGYPSNQKLRHVPFLRLVYQGAAADVYRVVAS